MRPRKIGRLKPHHGILRGRSIEFPNSSYYLRFSEEGKRRWKSIGTHPEVALAKLESKLKTIRLVGGEATTNHLAPGVMTHSQLGEAASMDPPDPAPDTSGSKRRLTTCAVSYLNEVEAHKSVKTVAAYRYAVTSFVRFCEYVVTTALPSFGHRRIEFVEDIRREDSLAWVSALKKKGDADRTVRNRVDHFQFLLHHFS